LGSRGTGQGGGGTALGIGGLGTKGSGGGAGGYSDVDLGGRGKEETRFVPGRTIVVGGLSRDVINRIIQRHYNEVKYCYEKELTKDPGLYGKVAVVFIIDGAGKVGDALVQQSTMGSVAVEGCILSHVRRWAFPAPEGGGTVQVTYPYVFKSSAQ
jgi:TonB family protein